MSSLTRSRSIRTKPTASAELPPRSSNHRDSRPEPRNESPSRLPYKTQSRAVSVASSTSSSSTNPRTTTTSTTTTAGRVPSGAAGSSRSLRPTATTSSAGVGREASVRRERSGHHGSSSISTGSTSASASSRYPPSTTATRPTVQTRPKSISGPSALAAKESIKKSLPGHMRSRSTVTSLNTSTVLKPPSSGSRDLARRPGTPTGRSRTPTASRHERSPTTSGGRSASGSTHGRSRTPSGARSVTSSSAGGRPTTPTASGRPVLRKASIEKAVVPGPRASQTQLATARGVSSTSTTAAAAAAVAQPQPKLRPAFSTLQQRYSPAKAQGPKPPTAAYLAPPSPSKHPANVAASAEVSKLQAELLQLYLLHRDAPTVDAQWRASARKKLGDRFAKICESSRDVAEQERAGVEAQNVLALRKWASSGGSLDEKIQSLEAIITGVWSLSDPGGRYARVVRRFERWIDHVCEIEDARRKGTSLLLQGKDGLFIGELDVSWKEEQEGLIRRLEGWKKQLSEIDHLFPSLSLSSSSSSSSPPSSDERYKADDDDDGDAVVVVGGDRSSLERMLAGSRSLIEDMLAELSLMEDIEQETLAREGEWIERMNRDDDEDDNDDEEEDDDDYEGHEDGLDAPRAGAVWRVM